MLCNRRSKRKVSLSKGPAEMHRPRMAIVHQLITTDAFRQNVNSVIEALVVSDQALRLIGENDIGGSLYCQVWQEF